MGRGSRVPTAWRGDRREWWRQGLVGDRTADGATGLGHGSVAPGRGFQPLHAPALHPIRREQRGKGSETQTSLSGHGLPARAQLGDEGPRGCPLLGVGDSVAWSPALYRGWGQRENNEQKNEFLKCCR